MAKEMPKVDHNIYIDYGPDDDYDLLYKKIMVGFKIFETILFTVLTISAVVVAGIMIAYFTGGIK